MIFLNEPKKSQGRLSFVNHPTLSHTFHHIPPPSPNTDSGPLNRNRSLPALHLGGSDSLYTRHHQRIIDIVTHRRNFEHVTPDPHPLRPRVHQSPIIEHPRF